MQHNVDEQFARIYDATARQTLGWLRAHADDPEDARDLFQEVYENLLSVLRRKGIDYIEDPPAFVRNLAKARLGKLRRPKAVELPLEFTSVDDGDELERWLASDFSLADKVEQRDLLRRVQAFVDSEPAVVRQVFYLRFGADMRLDEIAAELGLNESTVKSKLYRLLKKIRENFEM